LRVLVRGAGESKGFVGAPGIKGDNIVLAA
jgi:hypothetical protein